MIKIETDAGIDGYGPGPWEAVRWRERLIAEFMSDQGSAKGLGLIGKDPLAIEVPPPQHVLRMGATLPPDAHFERYRHCALGCGG